MAFSTIPISLTGIPIRDADIHTWVGEIPTSPQASPLDIPLRHATMEQL